MLTQIPTIKVEGERGILPLDEVLKYKNENVPHRFKKHFNLSDDEVDEIFNETLKWLWFCAVTIELNKLGKIDFIVGVIGGLPIIDHMWHNFILHTEEYAEFCDQYFNNYIHHVPTSKKEDDYRTNSAEKFRKEVETFYDNQYSLTYDLLGEETCEKWYAEYVDRYPRNKMGEIMKF